MYMLGYSFVKGIDLNIFIKKSYYPNKKFIPSNTMYF